MFPRRLSLLPEEAHDYLFDAWIFDTSDSPREIFKKALAVLDAWVDAKGDQSQIDLTGWDFHQINFLAALPNNMPKGNI